MSGKNSGLNGLSVLCLCGGELDRGQQDKRDQLTVLYDTSEIPKCAYYDLLNFVLAIGYLNTEL